MREIEFRGKHVHCFSCNQHLDGTWVYGYLCDENYINDKRDLGGGEYLGEMLVNPKTVGQYTGLLDKNGTKIFEGDIVLCNRGIHDLFDKTTFLIGHDEYFRYQGVSKSGNDISVEAFERAEVIGNIHDNPELLEVEK